MKKNVDKFVTLDHVLDELHNNNNTDMSSTKMNNTDMNNTKMNTTYTGLASFKVLIESKDVSLICDVQGVS